MNAEFLFDVFLSYSSKDKDTVRAIAERLRRDGLRVWFDEWELKPSDHILEKIEEALEHTRVLVLCMSSHAFSSDWAILEAGTFRFRDPLNSERRFIPLRLDDAPIKSSLAQFLYIDWFAGEGAQAYTKLLRACQPPTALTITEDRGISDPYVKNIIQLKPPAETLAYAFSPDGKRALSCGRERSNEQKSDSVAMRLWDLETGQCLRTFKGCANRIENITWSTDQRLAITASPDKTVQLWDIESGAHLSVLEGHTEYVYGVALSRDQRLILSSSFDRTIRLWDMYTGLCKHVFEGHEERVRGAAWSEDQQRFLSCADDNTVRLWEIETGQCLRVFEGHSHWVLCVAWSPDERFAISGSCDKTMRLWDVESGRCMRIFEGHTGNIEYIVWSADQQFIVSGSPDVTVRLWDVASGRCVRVFGVGTDRSKYIRGLAWNSDQQHVLAGDMSGGIYRIDVSEFITPGGSKNTSSTLVLAPDQVQYTNAKVLLVGESSAGKTGLSKALSGEMWEASDSTVGAWATQWKLPVISGDGVEREIWLWDFGGQADQRLIHQLYMDEAALAVLVFDGQKDNLFEMLSQWDRELTRASKKPFVKLLAAGRVDAGGLRFGRAQVDAFVNERGYTKFLETSAKLNIGCIELRQAILESICWDDIPCRTTLVLYRQLKEEIVRLKDAGRVLMRFNELREALQLSLSEEMARFNRLLKYLKSKSAGFSRHSII